MGDEPTRFRPTWPQAAARGLVLGVLAGAVLLLVTGAVAVLGAALHRPGAPSPDAWAALVAVPPLLGTALGAALGRWHAVEVDAYGIRVGPFATREPWARVVDLRAERRHSRTVVAVYLDGGTTVQLGAPYDGGLLEADPEFERKLFALSTAWRSHRIGRTIR
ncbi:hypothetical protein [Spirilliplanes yamanashiensis]|uniref:PH domain-containing protein n=1 Tax=Spirilliplanes yamanashiensis TaxID=42233 RepID=A0A8J3Y4N9_9ACTN|nr:hypothetical protein [Spirilliplanes yamanashiensis]MDP9819482.1 hypothetical protein [Spirilliplanes yamanashiensis]GIJ01696.1 hypothetical protein Sya03_10480 [Spirilliplanes yamanashiensis]